MINRVLSYLNRGRSDEEYFEYLAAPTSTPRNRDAMRRYGEDNKAAINAFFEYFADNLGTQIGTLHAKGVVHCFLHPGNLTADGTFVDIDSLRGRPFGEDGITSDDIARDISFILRGIGETINTLVAAGILSEDAHSDISRRFVQQYATTRWREPTEHTAGEINEFIVGGTFLRPTLFKFYGGRPHLMSIKEIRRSKWRYTENERWAQTTLREQLLQRVEESAAAA